jgi:hypothetical protein
VPIAGANPGEKEAENIFKWTQKFVELDSKQGKKGCELGEFEAHRCKHSPLALCLPPPTPTPAPEMWTPPIAAVLESLGETLSVVELRAKLRKIDLDANGKMALLEYLAFRFEKPVPAVANAPQGGDEKQQKAIDEASKLLDSLNAALAELQKALEAQKTAEAELKYGALPLHALLFVVRPTDPLSPAAAAVRLLSRKSVDALHAQQAAYDDEVKRLEQKSADPKWSTVLRNKAAMELAQLKQKDPLPLNRAKLTQAAALKRAEKLRAETEVKQADTTAKCDAAAAALEALKAQGGTAHGTLWFLSREVQEARK